MLLEQEFIDCYEILNIPFNSTNVEIKNAYRKKVKVFHPDNKETGNSSQFIMVREAYEILSNEEIKCVYDDHYYNNKEKYYRDLQYSEYKLEREKERKKYKELHENKLIQLSDEDKLKIILLFASKNSRFDRSYIKHLKYKFFVLKIDLSSKESQSLNNIIIGFMIDLDVFLAKINEKTTKKCKKKIKKKSKNTTTKNKNVK